MKRAHRVSLPGLLKLIESAAVLGLPFEAHGVGTFEYEFRLGPDAAAWAPTEPRYPDTGAATNDWQPAQLYPEKEERLGERR